MKSHLKMQTYPYFGVFECVGGQREALGTGFGQVIPHPNSGSPSWDVPQNGLVPSCFSISITKGGYKECLPCRIGWGDQKMCVACWHSIQQVSLRTNLPDGGFSFIRKLSSYPQGSWDLIPHLEPKENTYFYAFCQYFSQRQNLKFEITVYV